MSRKYSFIFSSLVENESDIVGHIAYALYKSDKVKYIQSFKDNNGTDPTEEDLCAFHSVSSQEDSIKKYRIVASLILKDFLDETLDESIREIEDECNNRHLELIKDVMTPLLPNSSNG